MYAEPTRSEGFSGVDNKSSTRNSSCSREDKSSTAAYGTADIVHFTKEDERNVHEMHLHLEDPSIFLDPVTSNSAELITTHENTSGGTEYDSSKRLPHTSDGLEEFKNWNCELEVPSVNKVAELQFEDSIDKDEAIKSLQEEVRTVTHASHVSLILVCSQRTAFIYRMCYLNFSSVRLIILKRNWQNLS